MATRLRQSKFFARRNKGSIASRHVLGTIADLRNRVAAMRRLGAMPALW
jgi:hypothetical protein